MAELSPQTIEQIAQSVARLLGEQVVAAPVELPVRLVDAAYLARHFGVERDWVYAHARELGAIRLGGARGRLRFDLQEVTRILADAQADEPPRQSRSPVRRPQSTFFSATELIPYDR